MDHWDPEEWELTRSERVLLLVASLLGAFAVWLCSQAFVHLRTRGASSHPVSLHRAPRELRG